MLLSTDHFRRRAWDGNNTATEIFAIICGGVICRHFTFTSTLGYYLFIYLLLLLLLLLLFINSIHKDIKEAR